MVPNGVFIRTKNIKGKQYAYLVENTWKNGRSRQRVVSYLGRVLAPPPAPAPKIRSDEKDILSSLIEQELIHVEEEYVFDKDNTSFSFKNRPVVFEINGGFLCAYTLQQIMEAKKVRDEDRPGTALAHAFAHAGLRIPKDAFITYYTQP